LRVLERGVKRGAVVGASCSATFVMAEAGLLDGREATTSWWLAPAFRDRYPRVRLEAERGLVVSGKRVTAGAALAQAELMLSQVARIAGPDLAAMASRYLLIGGLATQARFMVARHLGQGDPLLRAAEEWVRRQLDRQTRIGEMARALGTSGRT